MLPMDTDERERGALLVFVAIVLPVLLAFVALVVDLGRLYVVRVQLQNTADAAVLAAATELPDFFAVEAEAMLYGQLNMPDAGTVISNSDVTVGYWDPSAETFSAGAIPSNAVRVVAQRSFANGNPVDLFFAPIMGIYQSEVGAEAIATRSIGGGSKFLIDDEMIDTDIPAIEAIASSLGVTSDVLLDDADGDWFIDWFDYAGPIQIELPTGQVEDEALMSIDSAAFPFAQGSNPSFEDFLNYNGDSSWRQNLIPDWLLDPLLGVSAVVDASEYPSYVDATVVHVSPIYMSDMSTLNPVGGVPAINALGLRRGLIAFTIVAVGSDPDGPSGSVLPNLIIELVDPATVSLSEVAPSSGAGGVNLVK